MTRYLRLLRRRDYALLWIGATVSALGDGMSFIALVWLVLERGGDPGAVGWLAAAYTGPVVIGGLAAGLILDRFDRRRVLAADNLVRGIAIASIPVADALGVLGTPQLFVVAAVYGLLFMTSLAGIPSLIPTLVGDDELTTANAMESLSYGIAGLSGPALAGVVIAFLGAPAVLALDAVTYGIFVVCLLAMRPGDRAAESPSPAASSPAASSPAASSAAPAGRGLGPAIRFVLGAPAILAITVIYMAINIGQGIFIVLAPVYARDVLGGGATTYGTLVSAFTGGSLVGALLVGGIGWRWPLGRSIAAATLATGLAMGLLLATPPLVPTILTLALAGLLASSLTAWAQTIRMRLIPPELRGRVFALLRTLMQSTPPIGAVSGGILLAGGDAIPAIAAMAALIAIPGAVGLVLPALGREATGEPSQSTAEELSAA
ncbi:MAG TPA: MFS transporter [Candidatus Limnocylindrales bacterium]|nr:MFS transporter [Candidatus Limnocylindrales bacterium]